MEKVDNSNSQTPVTLYAVAVNTREHGYSLKGMTLVKLNDIKEAQPFLPTLEILKIHWQKEYIRVGRERILNEQRTPDKKVFTRMEPLCIGMKSTDFDAVLAALRDKCSQFTLTDSVIGCTTGNYSPCCLLCRVDEDKTTTE